MAPWCPPRALDADNGAATGAAAAPTLVSVPAPDSAPPQPAASPRHIGTGPSRRARRWQWAAAVGSLVVAGVAATYALSGGGDPQASGPPASSPASSAAAESATPTPSPSAGTEVTPGEIVVTAPSEGIALYDAAGAATPSDELGPWTPLGSPTTLLGFDREVVAGEEWIQVELPGTPNHRTAWVRAADASVTSSDARIDVYLAEREVELTVAGESSVIAEAVIGQDASPTPLGVFWVTDALDFTANPTGVYGAYALGLNGWSETLEEFDGGPPQIAVHGTNEPGLLGQAVSNGCVRLTNDTITEIARAEGVGVGTPVVVHTSRAP
ncbi:L,D-transpeptidase [Demequina sp. SO4-13]|uniref:L,D-transpeptidase n=1 Tax=Demequina sp. SO4-13 TaxID=3401027 RepID=UPI003AF681E7